MPVWFGTKDYMQWVKSPAVNMGSSKVGISNQTNYLSGGAHVRRSWNAHKEYDLSWNLASRQALRPILDYADGVYGTGPIYFVNPFAMDANVLPQYWATPFLGTLDAPTLDGKESRPSPIQTQENPWGYPTMTAYYNVVAEGEKPLLWLPCPPGHTLWLGVHGFAGTGGTVVATPTTGPYTTAMPTTLSMLSVATNIRVNTSFDGDSYTGVYLSMGGLGTVALSGIIAQVYPTGTTPPLGGFISGQGHSGLAFASQPTLSEYSAVMDKVGLSAKLVEVEAWL